MTTKIPQVACIFNRYKKASLSTKAVVEIRITYERKQKYISTGIMLFSNQWKNGKIIQHSDSTELNRILNEFLFKINRVIYEMVQNDDIDIFDIPNRLKTGNKKSFIEYCKERAIIRKYGNTKDSQERYDRFLKFFIEYGKIKTFKDITDIKILEYDKYLSNKKLKPYSKWNNYHRFLNSFINDAIDEGLLKRNPYKWINIEKDKNSNGLKRCLSPLEFNKIKDIKLPTKSLEKVRNVFLFQTYTCLSYSDLKNFDVNAISEIDGFNVYLGKRQKTKKPFTIPLIKDALDILYKYNKVLPVISNVRYNEYLKVIAQTAGIDKPISSHWARHTGATILLNNGIDIKIVSKICGHSSTRITESIYAKLLDETVVKAIRNIKRDSN